MRPLDSSYVLVNVKTKNQIETLFKGPWRGSSENIKMKKKLPTHILFKLILTKVNVIDIIEKILNQIIFILIIKSLQKFKIQKLNLEHVMSGIRKFPCSNCGIC